MYLIPAYITMGAVIACVASRYKNARNASRLFPEDELSAGLYFLQIALLWPLYLLYLATIVIFRVIAVLGSYVKRM